MAVVTITMAGGDELAVFLGENRQEAVGDITAAFNVGQFDGELNHLILDAQNFSKLTQQERTAIKNAYEQGFIVIIYDVTERQIEEIFELIEHPTIYNEDALLSRLDQGDDGRTFDLFTLEKIGDVNWSSMLRIGALPAIESVFGVLEPGTGISIQEVGFLFHAFHMEQWILDKLERIQQLEDYGLIDTNTAARIIKEIGIDDETQGTPQIQTRIAQATGNLTGPMSPSPLIDPQSQMQVFALPTIQTNSIVTGFSNSGSIGVSVSPDEVNTYTSQNLAYAVTAKTSDGLSTYLLVINNYGLNSANGFIKNDEGSSAFSNAQQYWYLSEFTSVNTLAIGSSSLSSSESSVVLDSPGSCAINSCGDPVNFNPGQIISGDISFISGSSPLVLKNVQAAWGGNIIYERANVKQQIYDRNHGW